MGLFDKIAKVIGSLDKAKADGTNRGDISNKSDAPDKVEKQNGDTQEKIMILPSSHMVEETEFGDNDVKYHISFRLNDAFKETKSHAAEVMMLNTYAPKEEYGEEGALPYIAVQIDDDVYCPVEEFKESGTFEGAIEITPLSGKFFFKAKKEYYGDIMYFYGLDRCDGFWENNGLCMVYPKSYVGTENEKKLMQILDEAAESYNEEKMA